MLRRRLPDSCSRHRGASIFRSFVQAATRRGLPRYKAHRLKKSRELKRARKGYCGSEAKLLFEAIERLQVFLEANADTIRLPIPSSTCLIRVPRDFIGPPADVKLSWQVCHPY